MRRVGILRDDRYFRACLECGERKPLGWMHDESICQGCSIPVISETEEKLKPKVTDAERQAVLASSTALS